jgi:hypothetical protein
MAIKQIKVVSSDASLEKTNPKAFSAYQKFIEQWYTEHESVSVAQVNSILSEYPHLRYSGKVFRAINIRPDLPEIMQDDQWDTEKLEDFIIKNEPKRYVSGSATKKGTDYFINNSGIDEDQLIVLLSYQVQGGLNLALMAKSVPGSKAEGIVAAEEILFIPKNGSIYDVLEP